MASIITAQSGFPFTPQLSYNPSNTGDTRNPVRPFLNPNFTGRWLLGNPSQWFNPAAFIAPPSTSGFFGNVGRDTYIGPGLATWDFSVLKDTRIRERLSLQFRAELFNILNRANFNTPNLIVFTPPTAAKPDRFLRHGGRDHKHFHHVAPGAIRPEIAVVVATWRIL